MQDMKMYKKRCIFEVSPCAQNVTRSVIFSELSVNKLEERSN